MESIKINTGKISLCVNDDPTRVISFSPTDLAFVERYYRLLADISAKKSEFVSRAEDIDSHGGSTSEGISLMREMCDYFCDEIDIAFGEGTSVAAFGGVRVLGMFEEFFAAITPFVDKERAGKMDKYLKDAMDEVELIR